MSQRKFSFIERGREQTIVFLPGWAFDGRIFERLDLEYNYLVPNRLSSAAFSRDLLECIREMKIEKISLFGWSLGGYLALDFLRGYPDLVEDTFLVSMRPIFPKEQIREQKSLFKRDSRSFLTQFYRNCFLGQKADYNWFCDHLQAIYLRDFSSDHLREGLDYLSNRELDAGLPGWARVRFFHGKADHLAPLREMTGLKETIPAVSLTVLKDSGHLPFLHPQFREKLHGHSGL